MSIALIDEATSAALADHGLAYDAIRQAMIAAAEGSATSFPVVVAHGFDPGNRLTIKSGTTAFASGAKIGSYWPGNLERGLPPHNSTIVLIDDATGQLKAVIEAGCANAYRTAAADALAVSVLAREDAATLAVFGAGRQAYFECEAVMRVRPVREVLIVNRDVAKAQAMAERLTAPGVTARVASGRDACQAADIVVTATASRSPLIEAEWIRPGTHVSCMGTDSAGKQEVSPDLLRRAAMLVCDLPAQSVVLGEFQHVAAEIADGRRRLIALGDILAGRAPGRTDPEAITVFDSSGLAAQDLAMAAALLERWREQR